MTASARCLYMFMHIYFRPGDISSVGGRREGGREGATV